MTFFLRWAGSIRKVCLYFATVRLLPISEYAKDAENLGVGEGIADLAVKTAQPIILPKDEGKNNLYKKMKRKDIKSSMIVPFTKGDAHDVYGVINLNRMASIALIPLHKKSSQK